MSSPNGMDNNSSVNEEKNEEGSTAITDNQTTLDSLGIRIVDQDDLEKKVANDADKAIVEKELEIERNRLARANDKYLKYKGKLLTLQKKLQNPNLKISEKTRLSVQIEELEENEVIQSLKDVNEIKQRVKALELKLQFGNDGSGKNTGTEQLPDETKEEFLIRTGKVTAFGTTSAFIEDTENKRLPTHKDLIMPGFTNTEEVQKNDIDKDITIISSDEDVEKYQDEEEDELIDDYEEELEPLSKSKLKHEENIDDGDEKSYQRRLKKWTKERSLLRAAKRPDYVDDPNIPEWRKPHPTINDAILNDNFKLPGDIFPSLFDYQKTCVQWLAELYSQKTGGIIGDEMGLGKTVQMISFLAGLHYSGNLKGPILIVCPATVLKQWCNEFHRWWPPFRTVILHSIGEALSKKRSRTDAEEEDDLFADDDIENEEYSAVTALGKTRENKKVKELVEKVVNEGHVIITTYAGLRIYAKYLLPVKWGYAVLDEGHKIRNPDSFITITCKQLNTPNRIILSGTPIQNNLVELWSLFDFIFPGRLGTLPVFQKQFCVPINLGGYANATNVQVQAGYKCAVILKDLVSPYLLRRVKADVAKDLPKKTEMVLFCKLTPQQRVLYKKFIESSDLKKILEGKRNALYGIDMLRKICNHPNLVDLGLKDKKLTKLPALKDIAGKSGKSQVVISLLELWTTEKRKTLIFSQTKQMLDILQQLLDAYNTGKGNRFKYMRMDGSTPIIQRQDMVDQFNTDPYYNVFLLTTRVGGLGVNLTGASRVIIYDPDWNPSTDMQARERAWRLGQKQDVAIYRLIMAGSIEEKIYHRQIFKQFLTNKILKDPKQKRFFKMTDMYDLFSLGDDEVKGTETADLFGTNEETFNGVKERKTRFKSRPGNLKLQVSKEGDDDLLQIAGVAKKEAFDDENVREKSMFDDDDSRVSADNSKNVLSELFEKSGIHSAVEHDAIIDGTHAGSAASASAMLVDNEATRISNEAVAALKESRRLARGKSIVVPTWTGKFGGKVKKRAVQAGVSSTALLSNLKRKREATPQKSSVDSKKLVTQISRYMADLKDNFSTSSDILENLHVDFSDEKTVVIIRQMLKAICSWDKERKGWVLKSEFR
ncbi:hypothetical protein CANINC_004338 [Pichia inconspicua]|uniref:DNA repair and recombination protein RAD26 n=1 Tax=Pichia inconspicua TaxID=52247 RepID=A0A4T0WWG1_9ASCO|nr:hypothetical protein CANINC_004338 [[Candida] inconspicua]